MRRLTKDKFWVEAQTTPSSSFVCIQLHMYLSGIIGEKPEIMVRQCHSQVQSHAENSALSMIFLGNETASVPPCVQSEMAGKI